MTINTTIPDAQAKALATMLRVSSYKDGNDLISQCGAMALRQMTKQRIIVAVTSIADDNTLADLFNSLKAKGMVPSAKS